MSKTYVVKNWGTIFESAETRKLDALRWVPTPNAHDGLGYNVLITAPDGPAMFGAWNAILQLASRGSKTERGRLERDGRALTAEDIALLIRMPLELVERTLEMCATDRIGWLDIVYCEQQELPLGNPASSGANPGRPASVPVAPARMEGKGIEWKEGKEEKEPAPKVLPPAKEPPAPQQALTLTPALSVVKTEGNRAVPAWIPQEMRMPEFVEAVAFYREHLVQKHAEPTLFEWQTLMIQCQRMGLRRSIQVIDFTMAKRAKCLIWDDCPPKWKPTRCRLPADVQSSGTALVDPPGFREWLAGAYPQQKGKGIADIAPHLRADILKEFHSRHHTAAA